MSVPGRPLMGKSKSKYHPMPSNALTTFLLVEKYHNYLYNYVQGNYIIDDNIVKIFHTRVFKHSSQTIASIWCAYDGWGNRESASLTFDL